MKNKLPETEGLTSAKNESGVSIRMNGGHVAAVKLNIFEPPRFFESFLRGRRFNEAPDITSRISGISPVAHQISACHAIENAIGVKVEEPISELRRLLLCGEWIKSHAFHIHMVHAPDFLGYPDATTFACNRPAEFERGLRLKKAGNEVVALIGGREIHPINICIGGFYKLPSKSDLASLAEKLKCARDDAIETVRWVSKFPFSDFERDYEFVALRDPGEEEYSLNEGRIVSNKGLNIALVQYERHFVEEQVPHSTALHSTLKDRGAYLVGPQARYSLNFDRLSPRIQETARGAGLGAISRNPFQSIIVRGVEAVYACEEALRILEQYETPDKPAAKSETHAGTGYGCAEAAAGLLYHRYTLDKSGLIMDAKIVSPTSQNQKTIEDDLRDLIPTKLEASKKKCDQLVRNYDPGISCAAH